MKIRVAPWLVAGLLALVPGFADAPYAEQAPPPGTTDVPTPTFRTSVNLVSSDVIVRDRRGQFQANLSKEDFELFEDGVPQTLASFVLVHGGRAYTTQVATAAPVREGIILPPSRPANDAAGRIILFIIDDLHLNFADTPRVRSLFKEMAKELVHEGDLFGIVSTGTSSIAIDLTYDMTRMEEAAKKITGGGLKPSEIIEQSATGETPQEVMHRANVAFETAYSVLTNLEKTQHRRKAIVLISNGYDFDPFKAGRTGTGGPGTLNNRNITDPYDPAYTTMNQGSQFNDTDLVSRLAELTRQANRSNATFYTFDPRGLVAGQDIDQTVDLADWENHLRKSQDSLRTIAELTGGIAVVNTNDFKKALKRIDAETSDYYVLAYYSTNPDPTQRRRLIDIRVKKKDPDGGDLATIYRREYTLRPLPAAARPK